MTLYYHKYVATLSSHPVNTLNSNHSSDVAPSSPRPRFTFCADIGAGALLTVLRTSPANVGIWKTQSEPVTHTVANRNQKSGCI